MSKSSRRDRMRGLGMTEENGGFPELLLFGGPLQKLGVRLGLARGEAGTFRLGLALGLPAWIVLVAAGFLQGLRFKVFTPEMVGVHVRILLVIPLFFACEAFVAPVIAEFARNLRQSRLVSENDWPALASNIRRARRLAGSWVPEAVFFLLVFALPLVEAVVANSGVTANWATILGRSDIRPAVMNGWYLRFCLPLFRFLALRWLWRLGLWWYFLWRLKKLRLQLIATHSDGAGGLGFLGIVQEHFTPLALVISGVFSASFAESIILGTMPFESLYGLVPGIFILVAGLFIGPLFLFTRELWDCRVNGLDKYMAMASLYVQAFERKWINGGEASGESQLGTSDLQSLADLSNSLNVVSGIRLAPGGVRLTLWLAISVIVPMLPLVLLRYPVDEVAKLLFRTLFGL